MTARVFWGVLILIASAPLCALPPAVAQDAAAPILKHTFEENDGGWQGLGTTATVSLTNDVNSVKSGKSALKFAYGVNKGELNMMLLPTPDRVLEKAKSFRFWIKADHSAPIAFAVQEKDGGRYSTIFTTQKDTWQQVEIGVSDLILDRSKDAPKDADGKLDMDEVEGVGILDFSQIFVQGEGPLLAMFGITPGARTLFLDDFTVSTDTLPSSMTLKAGEGSFDTFARPQIGWLGLGAVEVSKVTGKPLEGPALQAKYHQGPMKIGGLIHSVPPGALAGAIRLSLFVASDKPAKLVVQFEEVGGGKYNAMVEAPGGSARKEIVINIADLKPAQDSKDDNGKLDLDQVYQMIIFDASGLLGGADADNTLWINGLKAAK